MWVKRLMGLIYGGGLYAALFAIQLGVTEVICMLFTKEANRKQVERAERAEKELNMLIDKWPEDYPLPKGFEQHKRTENK